MNKNEPLPKEWVVFRLGHLGDVVLTTGVLTALGESHGWTFRVVTKQPWAGVFTHNPHVREILALEEKELKSDSYRAWCRRLAATCKGEGLLDLHGNLRSRLLSLFWQGPVLRYPKMGLQRRLFLLSGKRLYKDRLRSTTVAQRYYMAVESPPPPASLLLPRIWLSETEKTEGRKRLASIFSGSVSPIALHPYATHSLKSWPEEHWRSLAGIFDARGIPWLVIGKGSPLFPGKPNDLTNRTGLRESCALLSYCRALVSGDSGPMHLGTAMGAPVIALFGPTTREWGFFPAGPHDRVLELTLSCRPCSLHGGTQCPNNGDCLTALRPEEVISAIEQIPAKR